MGVFEIMKSIYVNVKMGLGGNIALARFIQSVDTKKYNFYVCSPYYDVFKAAKIPYYRPECIKDWLFDARDDEDSLIVEHRLYDMDGFIRKKQDYFEAWRTLCNIPEEDCDREKYNHLEMDCVGAFPDLGNIVSGILSKIKDKYILIQNCGSQSPLDTLPEGGWNKKPYDTEHEPLKRVYKKELAQKWVNLFKQSNPDVAIIQYALPNEELLDGCEHYTIPYLCYKELAKSDRCLGAFCIDSSLQHLITGDCKVMVLWGHSLPEHFGYNCNKNIIQKCRRDDILYFTELGPSGAKVQYADPAYLVEEFTNYILGEK